MHNIPFLIENTFRFSFALDTENVQRVILGIDLSRIAAVFMKIDKYETIQFSQ